jgi:hypothetical protein
VVCPPFQLFGSAELKPKCVTKGSKSLSLYNSVNLLSIQRVAMIVSMVLRTVTPSPLRTTKIPGGLNGNVPSPQVDDV